MLANAFWVIAYDTEYAMVDRDDDLRIGIQIVCDFFRPLRCGRRDGFLRGFRVLLVYIGRLMQAGWPFYAGCAFAAALAIYHFVLIRTRSRDGCMRAFRHNNWIGLAVFVGALLDQLVR